MDFFGFFFFLVKTSYRVVDQQMLQLFALGDARRVVFPRVILAHILELQLKIQCMVLL